MKSLILAAGIALLAIPQSAADGAVLSLGGPMSFLCYQSAVAGDAGRFAFDGCDRALSEESLTTPDRAATFVNRGILHMISGHTESADADFDAALKIDAALPDPWLNKGFLRLRDGQGQAALPYIEEAIKRQPRRQALAYVARALAHEDMGEFSSAYADLRRAHNLEPSWGLPVQYLARYHVNR
jgi:hypothetical protein